MFTSLPAAGTSDKVGLLLHIWVIWALVVVSGSSGSGIWGFETESESVAQGTTNLGQSFCLSLSRSGIIYKHAISLLKLLRVQI